MEHIEPILSILLGSGLFVSLMGHLFQRRVTHAQAKQTDASTADKLVGIAIELSESERDFYAERIEQVEKTAQAERAICAARVDHLERVVAELQRRMADCNEVKGNNG